MSSGFLNLRETMEYLGLKKTEIEKLVRGRKLTAFKIGGRYIRFKIDELVLLKHELAAKKETPSFFSSAKVQDFLVFNGFYIFTTLVLSALFVYFLVT